MAFQKGTAVFSEDEWSPLRAVVVGKAENSCFPNEPARMIKATMPLRHQTEFRPRRSFPPDILREAAKELEMLVSLLQEQQIHVYRPGDVDWLEQNGYTAAMPRDALLPVGSTIIESCFAWRSRRDEVRLAFDGVLKYLEQDGAMRLVRAPPPPVPDTLYDDRESHSGAHGWVINNSRPAFDAADFMRLGKILLGQLSNVTNQKGVEYIRQALPEGYIVETLEVNDRHAMHIDATILPLRPGLLVYNPERITERSLRKHRILQDWDLRAYPFRPAERRTPPLYMTSPWIVLNVLCLYQKRVVVEEQDVEMIGWLKTLGMEPIPCPFRHVQSIGGRSIVRPSICCEADEVALLSRGVREAWSS